MENILEKILATKKEEVLARKKRGLFFRPFWDYPRKSLKQALKNKDFAIIAEIKRASPSKGLIAKEFDPKMIAKVYEQAGAAAISCLTDEPFFGGHLEYLAAAREEVSLPILRKDFIIDEIQLEEARAFGADALLLIVAALSPERLKDLLKATYELGLEALVEVHDKKELEIALNAGAEIIGINNRNLKTFEVSLETSLSLAQKIPEEVVLVSESGIKDHTDILRLKEAGIRAALIGESLMRAQNKESMLGYLLKGQKLT
ncbi:indole-3-glycerol phosphate synthase TrpC [Thermodesulfatator autotrophicus]|uniref:Indole-3-glycerol phosphate synthase n=1 Tax=Thermodesulfatator autotrophicus TaxID=1795632 RepID=A0A177E885_9BACT|nr:indole-3-glycerol phosphate synthase TrpC [Thermodesulfatator autotrophicus]OAG28115.1 indole-3-glycerol phosphate synthase [Thermodesulfatator autotrophicus]